MKYGLEVEGVHKGQPMIFCSATEILSQDNVVSILKNAIQYKCSGIYIEDENGVHSYEFLSSLFAGYLVTVDTKVVRPEKVPANIIRMLRMPDELFALVDSLTSNDMIKFEHNRTVKVFAVRDTISTQPSDFEKDITL